MKLDGVNMETTEPTEAVAEPFSQENASSQASPQPDDAAKDAGSNGLASVSPLCKEGTKLGDVNVTATEPSSQEVAEPSPTQENQSEEAARPPEDTNAAPGANPKANGRPVASVEPKCSSKKPTAKAAASSGTNPRAGTATAASHRPVNDVRASNNVSALAVRKMGANAKSTATGMGAVPKRPVGAAAASPSVKSQTRVPDKRPVGQARTTSVVNAAAAANGTKPTSASGAARKRTQGSEAVGAARPKNSGELP